MSGNHFGTLFRVTTCGESHGPAIGVIIDGCPAGLPITADEIQTVVDQRKPGQNHLTSPRQEKDTIHILSGVFQGKTTGAPILLLAYNQDMRPADYEPYHMLYRPAHADYTYQCKYGHRDFRGSGRASARETLARVAAGAIASKYLKQTYGITIFSYVEQIGSLATSIHYQDVSPAMIEQSLVRCPDTVMSHAMIQLIETVKEANDSIGGIIRGVIRYLPIGLGEPVFDKLPADLAKAMLSINAAKGFDIGAGFTSATMRGSEHNDPFLIIGDQVRTASNFAGGTLGGIANGEDVYFRVAFKPPASIRQSQQTINTAGQAVTFAMQGRHDPCVVPRAVPIVTAMAALVVMDHVLRWRAYHSHSLLED